MVNQIVVNLDCTGWWNLQVLSSLLQWVTKLFTVSDETYIGTHRRAPVSFITDCKSYANNCKSDDSTCKFCQPLQSVMVIGTAIWLTSQGGVIEIKPSTPQGGDWNKFLISYNPGGCTGWGGGDWKRFTGTKRHKETIACLFKIKLDTHFTALHWNARVFKLQRLADIYYFGMRSNEFRAVSQLHFFKANSVSKQGVLNMITCSGKIVRWTETIFSKLATLLSRWGFEKGKYFEKSKFTYYQFIGTGQFITRIADSFSIS